MDDVPPVQLIDGEVRRVVESEQEEDRNAPQSQQQDVGDRRPAAPQDGQGDVVEEDQGADDDADLDPERLLEKLAPLVDPHRVADHRAQRPDHQDRQLEIGQHGALDVALRLLGDEVVGRPEEAEQEPDDQRVGVDHAQDVEGQYLGQEVRHGIDGGGERSDQDLDDEQRHGADEVPVSDSVEFRISFVGSPSSQRHFLANAFVSPRRSAASPEF